MHSIGDTREAGAGALPAKTDADTSDQASQEAKKEGAIRAEINGRSSERAKPTSSPSTEKVSGAGPAIAEHSKDAKAPKAGRQPGAYVKNDH
jgi:hypothetical protein